MKRRSDIRDDSDIPEEEPDVPPDGWQLSKDSKRSLFASDSAEENKKDIPQEQPERLVGDDSEAKRWDTEQENIEAYAESPQGGGAYGSEVAREMYEQSQAGGEITQSVGNETSKKSPLEGHLVPANVIDSLDVLVDEKKVGELAESQNFSKPVGELPDKNLRGLVGEGMDQRRLEDIHGPENVIVHPKGLKTTDGRDIQPDFAITDDKGKITELHDAKSYTRKDTQKANPTASELTHTTSLKKAGKYIEVDDSTVQNVVFDMPDETAKMKPVQESVEGMSTENRSASVEALGSEADVKQRVEDLRTDVSERHLLSESTIAEVKRIQALPQDERKDAWSAYVMSLKDEKGDPTAEWKNLSYATGILRDGKGVNINDIRTGKNYIIWF